MLNGVPTEVELRDRILNQLSWHDVPDTVALLWHGYLGALLEWGLIEVHVYDNLQELLPKLGIRERQEMFLDQKNS